ncbi:hypothetical protein AJ80_07582 [Polytolypa hystricis UAMH7299]|uniref:Peroxin-3 n=1 Tax=Polytolypa hystricis (strain UAMH7299) TaxID=1447883 RepID=A0A2B7XMY1_POLH7|nr:hypothetical protein AJ80_07582 [Polytolypa hystricis UAMH7299]
MIAATRRWARRHRNGIAIGVGVIGAGYLAGQYVLSKISEAKDGMISRRTARENLRRRFEQNQTDCTFTVLALLPTATENILEALPVEDLTNELQRKKAERLSRLSSAEATGSEISSVTASVTDFDGRSFTSAQNEGYVHASQLADSTAEGVKPRSRTQLWNELKVNSLTRSFTLLYTLSLLTLLTRIQLNLLGRRNYLSSVVSLASPPENPSTISLEDHDDDGHAFGNDFETNRRYLTFSWWLLHRGWKDLMDKVKEGVDEVFGPLNPREDITQQRLSELTLEVRKRVEGATDEDRKSTKWLPYLLPPKEQEDFVLKESGVLSASETSVKSSSTLRHLLDETSDLIDSPTFSHILTLLNNEAFSTLIDNKCAAEAFKLPAPSGSTTQTPSQPPQQSFSSTATIIPASDPSPPKAKLATVLAVVSRQAHNIGNGAGPQNEYLAAMEQGVRELEAFAAVVYSSNFDLRMSAPGPESNDTPVVDSSTVALASSASQTAASKGVDETETPPGGEASIIDLGDSSVSIGPAAQKDSGVGGDNDASTPNFEQAWGKAVEHSST